MNDFQEIILAESRYARVNDSLLLFLRQFDGEVAVLAVGSPGCANEVSRLHLGDFVIYAIKPDERYEVRLMAAKGGGRKDAQAVILVTRLSGGHVDANRHGTGVEWE